MASGGLGGEATATLAVQRGQVFEIVVGGQGSPGGPGGSGGFNGRGDGSFIVDSNAPTGGGGGGASDVRAGSCGASKTCDLQARILVAGGGGGAGSPNCPDSVGGFGGGLSGGNAPDVNSGAIGDCVGGLGGTQTAGGGSNLDAFGSGESLGSGPATGGEIGAGAGGGGWYGGGAGSLVGGGGGGGSGYLTPSALFGSFQSGVQAGDGRVVISKTS